MTGETTLSGVPCTGRDGACPETFTITETSTAAGTTDPTAFDCANRCDTAATPP